MVNKHGHTKATLTWGYNILIFVDFCDKNQFIGACKVDRKFPISMLLLSKVLIFSQIKTTNVSFACDIDQRIGAEKVREKNERLNCSEDLFFKHLNCLFIKGGTVPTVKHFLILNEHLKIALQTFANSLARNLNLV